ncbi:MAG: extracellular solute-binding protein family 5 [Firmicutes bacterium]|nr:extracellular solute-binding protein family 5 [Bacillota bacterium]
MNAMRRKAPALAALLTALALIVSACGGSPKDGATAGGTGGQQGQPVKGGTLTVARIEDTETLDPQRTTAVSSNHINAMVYDTLVVQDYDMSLKPHLAEKWEISDDQKTYTFHLKQGVKFWSGKDFKAADAKYTLERWLGLKGSPSSYLIKPIDKVEAKDDYTVVVTLKEPYGLLLTNLASPYASMLNSEFTKQHDADYGTKPETVDGTGPFKITQWSRNDSLTLERNDAYTWGPGIVQNKGPAYVDKIIWKVIPEGATRMAELETGNAQFTADVPAVDVARLKSSQSVKLVEYSDFNTVFIGMRTNKAPLDDIKVRQAIQQAINKQEVVDGGFYGLATEAKSPVAPGLPGAPADAAQTSYKYDPAKAGQLLDEAGWKMGANGIREKDGKPLKLELWYSKGANIEVVIPMLQAQLKKVGIQIDLKQLEWAAYLEALRAGKHELMYMSIRYTTADGVLYFYFHSGQRPAPNRFEYVNKSVDDLLDKARASSDDKAQAKAWEDVQAQVMKDAFWIPIVHEKRVTGVAPTLQGLKLHPANVLYKGLDLWLSK